MSSLHVRSFALLVSLGFWAAPPAAHSDDGTLRFRASSEATFHSSGVDANGDGGPAVFGVAHARTSLGPATSEGWVESLGWDGVTFCGPTHVQIEYLYAERVFNFANGSRLFLVFESGSLCVDYSTGTFTADGTLRIVGGAGRLSNASGTIAFHLRDGRTLPSGLIVFSESFEGEIDRH